MVVFNTDDNGRTFDFTVDKSDANEKASSKIDTKKYNTKAGAEYTTVAVIEIPKINLKNGFLNLGSRYNDVSYNVTVINGSTFPDQENSNLILAAHSGNCYICYFDKLYKLQNDDLAYISYNNKKYTYKLVKTYEVEKTGKVAIYKDSNKSGLVLITCTRNSDTKQSVYIFDLIDKQ